MRGWLLTIRTVLLVLLAGSVAAVNGCEGWTAQETPSPKEIRVVALREPLSRVRPGEGLEHDLLWHFAQSHKARMTWKWVNTPQEALSALRTGKADVAAGRWPQETPPLDFSVISGPAYEESVAVLICRRDLRSQAENSFLENLFAEGEKESASLIERVPARVGLHYRDWLPRLVRELENLNPQWNLQTGADSALILAADVARKRLDCFVTDRTTGRWLERLRPHIRIVRDLDYRFSRAFLFSAARPSVEVAFSRWFQQQNRAGAIRIVRHRYFGFEEALSEMDRARLLRAKITHLPALTPKFKRYAKEFDLPWQLLAAVAYQESHWNNEARSFTGVRGIMQLTLGTARYLGVENREDLDQSLWGGAKYLRFLIDQQPAHLHPRDRLTLALAAYNVGMGHLQDAQKLAVESGRDPFSFWDLRHVLPQLSDPEIAARLQFGLARGHEPVHFTKRVLAFYDLLSLRGDVL